MEHIHTHSHTEQSTNLGTLKDPVCGMVVTPVSVHHVDHQAKTYYFCSASCKAKFKAEPGKYLVLPDQVDHVDPAPAISGPGAVYTCPMHPEIRQDHPGICPKCGMALEPLLPKLDEDENPELRDFTRRFWWTLPLTIVVTVLAMFGHQLHLFDASIQTWIELFLTLPIVLWAGTPFFLR